MIAMLLAVLASQAALDGEAGTTHLSGRCQYPDTVARFRQEASLALCNSLAIDRGVETATFDFSQRSWGSMLRFTGAMSGQRMAVNSVRLRSGSSVEATGTCEIFYSSKKISVVTCLAKAGSKTFAANFVPSRL